MSDDSQSADDGAPRPDRTSDFESPGPGRGGPRFGPVGGVSGAGIEPGRITADPIPAAGELAVATTWPERDEWALPSRYHEDTVVALVRDPWWVFVYWELDDATRAASKRKAGDGARFVLRVYEVGGDERMLDETLVHDIAVGDWYVPVRAPRLRIRAVMGYLAKDGAFHPVLESDEVPVPAFESVPPVQLETDGPKTVEDEIFEFSGGHELADAQQWRQQRTRPILWKRRQIGGWKTLREGGSGSGIMGMEMRFGPPVPEMGPTTEGPPPEDVGPAAEAFPSSPTSPFGGASPSSPFGGSSPARFGRPSGEDES
jgi:hypothetical protein